VPRSKGRGGRPWRRARLRCLTRGDPCAWCGNPIDLTIPYPHPLSAVVDHITSLVLGGDPLDPHNHQPMHKVCNEEKERRRAQKRATPASRVW
jgi:hypothetical protein